MMFAESESVVSVATLVGVIGTLGGVIWYLFTKLISSKDIAHAAILKQLELELKEKEAIKVSLKAITDEAVIYAREVTNHLRKKEGLPPVPLIAPVIPESASPSTQLQRDAAHISTQRATLAALQLSQGNPPRPEPPEAQLSVETPPVPKG